MEIFAEILFGDCTEQLKQLPDNSVDLIVTSPPYADQRKNTYGGISVNQYVEWFLPITKELLRVLKPTGTFILNIKEKVQNGERSTYVLELILEMRKQGWLWTEEFIWHKKNCYPGKWPNRFRDAWERLLQFNKSKKFNMYQESVMVPTGDWAKTRLKNLSETDKTRDNSKVGSGFGKNISNWEGRDMAYPTNVLHLATECGNKNHSAAFPEALPEWFIKLFTKEGDTVLDPFMGSGTTNMVAQRMHRNSIGIEIKSEYYQQVKEQLLTCDLLLFETPLPYGEQTNSTSEELCGTEYRPVSPQPYRKSKNSKAKNVLSKKNPYLFKAKYSITAYDVVKSLVDAYLSSAEETIFGDWMEGLAIFVNQQVYGGWKSSAKGVDLEFDKGGVRYIVSIKSGPNWGNSSQVNKLKEDFKSAKKTLRTSKSNLTIEAINGCCYGKDNSPDKGDYMKYCGQDFWYFISGEKSLYVDIIEPLATKAKERNEEFQKQYSQMINLFTKEFIDEFCKKNGEIDWKKLVEFNSGSKTIKTKGN